MQLQTLKNLHPYQEHGCSHRGQLISCLGISRATLPHQSGGLVLNDKKQRVSNSQCSINFRGFLYLQPSERLVDWCQQDCTSTSSTETYCVFGVVPFMLQIKAFNMLGAYTVVASSLSTVCFASLFEQDTLPLYFLLLHILGEANSHL